MSLFALCLITDICDITIYLYPRLKLNKNIYKFHSVPIWSEIMKHKIETLHKGILLVILTKDVIHTAQFSNSSWSNTNFCCL
jgi:hypothetical protein